MTAYRFCRSDDLELLAAAHEHCRGPEDAAATPLDRAGMKVLIREIDLWSSSSMVALEGREPVGVLLGAKRDRATLVAAVRVHPDHRRRGHARHLLASLSAKLAILGPPRLVAEVPADRPAALGLFEACGWRREERLLDLRRDPVATAAPPADGTVENPIAPLEIEEALASGLLADAAAGWRRDPSAFLRQADRLAALGFWSPERLEAVVVHRALPLRDDEVEVLALGAAGGELGRLGLRRLVAELERRAEGRPLRAPRVAPAEAAAGLLRELAFRPERELARFAAEAHPA
jgi:ribosomal protein S18 acetylase RimI-like enzyme